jgi:transposase
MISSERRLPMEQKKKRFNQEFKDSAVQLVESGKSAAQVARELGLPDWQIQTWVRDAHKKKKNPSDQVLLEENKRLKKQLAKALEETEILKKAAAFFARNQQ